MDKVKDSHEKTAREIAQGLIEQRVRPLNPQVTDDKKPSLLERLRTRDKPALATPDAHGPG